MIHVEVIFVYSVRKGSNFMLSQVHIQLPQHHVLRKWLSVSEPQSPHL